MKHLVKYPGIVLVGIALGLFIVLPLSEFANYLEYRIDHEVGPVEFVLNRFINAITFKSIEILSYYSVSGIVVAIISFNILDRLKTRKDKIIELKQVLSGSLIPLIKQGESQRLEFKSSFRFDIHKNATNKALEMVVFKTIAGFMNAEGGTLLIGVNDKGDILGLENDYQTLKKKNSDGLEQLLMSSIADRMGTPACKFITIVFHKHQDKEVCRLVVRHAKFPIYLRDGNMKKFYIRTGSGTREMDIQEGIDYISSHWQ